MPTNPPNEIYARLASLENAVKLLLLNAQQNAAEKETLGADPAECETNPPMRYVLAFGNPVDGFEFVGPFTDRRAAEEYRSRYSIDDCWTILLQRPAQS
jgi:hypothetical protein